QIVGVSREEQVERAVAIGGGLHGVPLLFESLADEAQDLPIVLNHENAHSVSDSSYLHHARRNSICACKLAAWIRPPETACSRPSRTRARTNRRTSGTGLGRRSTAPEQIQRCRTDATLVARRWRLERRQIIC